MGIVFPPGRLSLSRNGQNENGSEGKFSGGNGRISRNGRGKPAVRPIAGITAAQAGSVPPIADEAWRSAPAADLARTDGVNEILMQKDRKAFR